VSLVVPQVFISSTSEFETERQEIAQEIRRKIKPPCIPFIYEEEPADRISPEKYCSDMIAASEVLVLVLGASYGSRFPDRNMSIVEWEYEEAKRHHELAIHPYVKELAAGTPIDPPQAAFVARIVNFHDGHWSKFLTADELPKKVVEGINAWRGKALARFQMLKTREAPRQQKTLLVATAAVALMTTAGIIASALMGNPLESTAVIAGGGVSVIVILGVLLKMLF